MSHLRLYMLCVWPFWLKDPSLSIQAHTFNLHCTHFHSVGGLFASLLLVRDSWYEYLSYLLLPFHAMSVPAEIVDLYSQYDFIPDEIYRGWAEAGFPIGASLEWLMVPQGLANAYLTAR